MTNEISLAFGSLADRSIAMNADQTLDRISVRDYAKDIEIGAFQAERDTVQGVRFNVVVEVAASTAAQSDDVDLILSYDMITEAIEAEVAAERVNLLETLAERIANTILLHRAAQRCFVRIEKTDRIPGTLGVEIVRDKAVGATDTAAGVHVTPMVVFLDNEILHGPDLQSWLDAIAQHSTPAIICVEPAQNTSMTSQNDTAKNRIGLLSIEQNAWVLAGLDSRCVVVDSRTELDWAIKNGQLSVWAPSRIFLDTVDKPAIGPDQPLELASWFADVFGDGTLRVLGSNNRADRSGRVLVVKEPASL